MTPKDLSINDFVYDLPEDRIAKYPLPVRDQSKCLILNADGSKEEDIYANIYTHIPANSMMVFNNTKVVEARIFYKKETGSTIELFCLEPDDRYADITEAMLSQGEVIYKCLVGGAKKWKSGTLDKSIDVEGKTVILSAEQLEKRNDYFIIRFSWNDKNLSFAEILHHAGIIPLPPYLKRETEESDKKRYQTVYAKHDGSVAAPTAGLHFTESLLQNIKAKGIIYDFLTLHVGAGTFKPVKAEKMSEHDMHYEAIDVKKAFLDDLYEHIENRNVIAVGTTSLRTLESLYWIGVKLLTDKNIDGAPEISQWEPYELPQHYSAKESIETILNWLKKHNIDRLITRTQIIIAPGYDLRVANAIVTNFHQPKSTLILLIAAVIGERWKELYEYALSHDFRFLSYGDGSLLWKQPNLD